MQIHTQKYNTHILAEASQKERQYVPKEEEKKEVNGPSPFEGIITVFRLDLWKTRNLQ